MGSSSWKRGRRSSLGSSEIEQAHSRTSGCVCISQKWIIVMMGFFALFNSFTLRTCLSIAITKMAKAPNRTDEVLADACPPYGDIIPVNSTAPVIFEGAFEWSEYTQGIILSSFYWGYLITQIPGGLLAEKYGPKYTIGLGTLVMAILSVITPVATVRGGANVLIFIRFLMGLGGGVVQPALSCLLSQWIPANERSFLGSIVYAGVRAGVVVSFVISGFILDETSDDWPIIFYWFGGIGMVWFVFWVVLCYNNPHQHPFITEKEKNYLHKQLESHTHKKPPPFPWKHALTSKAFIAFIIMESGNDLGHYVILSDLPKYLDSVLRLPVLTNGYVLSANQIGCLIVEMVFSWVSDWLVRNKRMTTTQIRKINTTISSLGPGILMLIAVYVGCDVITAVTLITIGLSFTGCSIPGILLNVLDLSPNYAGTLMGIGNGIATLTGILAPYLVGVLAPNQTLTEWRLIFWIVLAVYVITNLNFIIFASGEVQSWNDPRFLNDGIAKGKDENNDAELLPINNIQMKTNSKTSLET